MNIVLGFEIVNKAFDAFKLYIMECVRTEKGFVATVIGPIKSRGESPNYYFMASCPKRIEGRTLIPGKSVEVNDDDEGTLRRIHANLTALLERYGEVEILEENV